MALGKATAGYRNGMKPVPRFRQLSAGPRPRGRRLIEMYSLKLGRRVTAHSYAQFELLLGAEVNHAVSAYCERPLSATASAGTPAIDLWQQGEDGESFAMLSEQELPERWLDLPIRRVVAAELAAMRCWLSNWQCMLPVVITTQEEMTRTLLKDIRRIVSEAITLARIERELVTGEPTLVRGGVFKLLLEGVLAAPSLYDEPLSLSTRFSLRQ